MRLLNRVIRGSGEPVTTKSGIRAASRAGAAGVEAKSVNGNPAASRQLDRAGSRRDAAEWIAAVAAIDRRARQNGQFVAASVVYASADCRNAGRVRSAAEGMPLWVTLTG